MTGLDTLSELAKKFTAEPSSYSPQELRACLNGFRQVLFEHLDQEVRFSQTGLTVSRYSLNMFSAKVADLRGENLRKYWTLNEVQQIMV
jgi:hypothetical protein